jgi:hypothetical protein
MVSGSHLSRFTSVERASGTHWIGATELVWTLWRRDKSCLRQESNPGHPLRSYTDCGMAWSMCEVDRLDSLYHEVGKVITSTLVLLLPCELTLIADTSKPVPRIPQLSQESKVNQGSRHVTHITMS